MIARTQLRPSIARARLSAITAAVLFWPGLALAAGSNMPWEQPLTQILDSVQVPVAKILAVIIIIGSGLVRRDEPKFVLQARLRRLSADAR